MFVGVEHFTCLHPNSHIYSDSGVVLLKVQVDNIRQDSRTISCFILLILVLGIIHLSIPGCLGLSFPSL